MRCLRDQGIDAMFGSIVQITTTYDRSTQQKTKLPWLNVSLGTRLVFHSNKSSPSGKTTLHVNSFIKVPICFEPLLREKVKELSIKGTNVCT